VSQSDFKISIAVHCCVITRIVELSTEMRQDCSAITVE
jgi:hypothetical protein